MKERDFQMQTADILTDEPHVFKIYIQFPSLWLRLLIWLKLKKPYREFALKPLVLGKLVLISKLFLKNQISVDEKTLNGPNIYTFAHEAAIKSAHDLAHLVAIAVCDTRRPAPSLVKFIYENLTIKELSEAAKIVTSQVSLTDFLTGIVSMKTLNILETNPEAEEIIAFTQPSEAL